MVAIALKSIAVVYPGEEKEYQPYVGIFKDGNWEIRGTLRNDSAKGKYVLGGTAVVIIDDVTGKVIHTGHEE